MRKMIFFTTVLISTTAFAGDNARYVTLQTKGHYDNSGRFVFEGITEPLEIQPWEVVEGVAVFGTVVPGVSLSQPTLAVTRGVGESEVRFLWNDDSKTPFIVSGPCKVQLLSRAWLDSGATTASVMATLKITPGPVSPDKTLLIAPTTNSVTVSL